MSMSTGFHHMDSIDEHFLKVMLGNIKVSRVPKG